MWHRPRVSGRVHAYCMFFQCSCVEYKTECACCGSQSVSCVGLGVRTITIACVSVMCLCYFYFVKGIELVQDCLASGKLCSVRSVRDLRQMGS